MHKLKELFVRRSETIREIMVKLDRGAKGIVLMVDDQERLLATITDGDIRRAILANLDLKLPVQELFKLRREEFRTPTTAPVGTPTEELLKLMQGRNVRQLPLLDADGRVADLVLLDELVPERNLPVQAVIMAGGFGTRLAPLTDNTPKPMLPIGGRPLMERTIERLKRAGIRNINITTHYLPEKITGYFGDGRRHGVNLNYVSEDRPLGTAGALGLVGDTDEPLLVMNGDILTRVDFQEMLRFHRQRKADLTVAVRQYDVKVPYGVVESSGGRVVGLREKPQYDFLVNAGIYLLEPSVRRLIPPGERFNMTDLIEKLLEENRCVASFPIVEYWLDIGKHDDFQQAQEDVREMRWAS